MTCITTRPRHRTIVIPQLLRPAGRSLAFIMLASLLIVSPSAQASPQAEKPAPQAPPNAESPLVDSPVVIEELGVSINPPRRAALSKERGPDGQSTVTIADASPEPVWQIRIQALVPELENPTPEALIQDHVAKLKEAGRDLTVLSSKEVTISGVRGWQAFLTDTKAEDPLVNGYLILPGQGPPFVVISFVCTLSDFARMRTTLEAALASVKIDSPQRISDEREGRLQAGAALIASFDTATLKELVGLHQWFRHYRPVAPGEAGGDVEIGVSNITVREGKRGELNADRKPSQYDKGEQQDGLLVIVQARVVVDGERDIYYDTLAQYWMSWDDAVEAWSIVASRKHKANAISEAETGYRRAKSTGEPNGILYVVNSGVEGANREPREWTLPDYYLSQPYAWLLGHLMASTNAAAGDYAFYAYDSSLGSLSLRQDVWAPKPGGGGAGTLTSRFTVQAPPIESEFDSDGKLIRRARPDGSLTVPTTVQEIRRLWDAKGLKLVSDS
jgi:hypothetical protein